MNGSTTWIVDLEIALVRAFGWSLRDLDETDIESLLPFMYRFAAVGTGASQKELPTRRVYCDEVTWL